jgi:hypothetical protein
LGLVAASSGLLDDIIGEVLEEKTLEKKGLANGNSADF